VNTDRDPTASTYLGLFFVALATVMYEIVLTRIFSVTMWYHFAFVAISIAALIAFAGASARTDGSAAAPTEAHRRQGPA